MSKRRHKQNDDNSRTEQPEDKTTDVPALSQIAAESVGPGCVPTDGLTRQPRKSLLANQHSWRRIRRWSGFEKITQRRKGAETQSTRCWFCCDVLRSFKRLNFEEAKKEMSSYKLESVNLPKLTGRSLRMFASFLDTKIGHALLWGKLARDAGLTKLEALDPQESPAFEPNHKAEAAAPEEREVVIKDLETIRASEPVKTPYATIGDYAKAYRDGTTTPTDVATRVLAAIEKTEQAESPLRLFIAIDSEDVHRQAKEAAARLADGKPLSILDGVPIAIKDELDMVPFPTTVGTGFLGREPAHEDATVVSRLRAAGAVLVGKCNMHEIGINPTGANLVHGHCRNPWDISRDPGGSSSGSAAAVAAGVVPAAIGADGGGSIRVPAALCGTVGLKATWGRVSEYGAAPLCWSVAHVGPLAATVEDTALLYRVIAGSDPNDPNSQCRPAVTVDGWSNDDLTGLRLGVYPEWFDHCDDEIRSTCQASVDNLIKQGAKLVEVEIPELEEMRIAHAITILSEMAASLASHDAAHKRLAPSSRINLRIGGSFQASDYVRSQRMRRRALDIFAEVFKKVDVVVTPATALAAPLIPEKGESAGWSDLSTVTELMRYANTANLTGHPAIAVPVGFTKSGLPIGLQIIGRPWEEHILFKIAHSVERVAEHRSPEDVFFRPVDG